MKFYHKFKLSEFNDNCRIYKSGEVTARLDFISPSCIRVSVFKDENAMLPTFSVNPDNKLLNKGRSRLCVEGFGLFAPECESDGETEKFKLKDGVSFSLDTNNFLLKYYKNERLLFCDREPTAYNFNGEMGTGCRHYISRDENEIIYGLGDKGGKVNKYGRSFRIEATDCMGFDAESSDPLYKHLPFFICENSEGCYGIFYDTSDVSYFDFGKEINNYYQPYKYFKTDDDCLVYYVFFGSKLEILRQFSRLCGKQAFPPKWSFDYCASTMAYTDAPNSQERMNGFLKELKNCDFSCKGFYLSSGYTSIGGGRYVFNWNREKFPDPYAFVRRFKEAGIEIIPNIKPAFLCSHPMYGKIENKSLFIKNPDSTPFITRFWDGEGSYLDFTNDEAFDFWKSQVKSKLLDCGILSSWNDNNEFDIKDCDAVARGFGRGEVKASRICPSLTYLMVLSSYIAQLENEPDLRPFLSSRSSSAAVRRLAQTWSGDNRTAWKDLRYCHRIGLTMSMSGLYFYGHDLGGFDGDMPSRELLLRWLQHGVFEPRFTIHSWNKDGSATMPWSYPDILGGVRQIFALRKRLIPYIYNCAYEAVEKDLPVNAPPKLYYDDKNIDVEDDCAMLGRDILAAFIFDEGREKTKVYLPERDDWYLGDKLIKGGREVEITIPADSEIPYFVRAGSVIPTDEAQYGFKSEEDIRFTVYPKKSGKFTSEFFTDDGVSFNYMKNLCVKAVFTVECDKNEVRVYYKNSGKMPFEPKIRLCGADKRKLTVIKNQKRISPEKR